MVCHLIASLALFTIISSAAAFLSLWNGLPFIWTCRSNMALQNEVKSQISIISTCQSKMKVTGVTGNLNRQFLTI